MMLAGWLLGLAMQAPGYGGGVVDMEQVRPVLLLYGFLFSLGLALDIYLLVRFIQQPAVWVRKINRLLWRPWGLADVLFIVLVLAVMHLFVLGIVRAVQATGWLDGFEERYLWVVVHSVVLHWAVIVVVLLRAVYRNISWQAGFSYGRATPGSDFFKGLAAYVAAVPVLVFYAAMYHVWLQWSGHEPAPQDAVRLFAELEAGWMFFYFIFLAVVVAPVAEELLFRGILLPALGRRWGMGAAIMISSVLFAFMHFHVPSLVPLFVFSIALSLAYVYTESIIVPIVMHMLFNAVSLSVMMLIG